MAPPSCPSGHPALDGTVLQMAHHCHSGWIVEWVVGESDIIKLDMVVSEEWDGKSPDLRLPYEDKAPITDPLVQHRAHLSRAQFSQSLGSHV